MIDALLRGRLAPRAFPRANLDRGARGQGRAVNQTRLWPRLIEFRSPDRIGAPTTRPQNRAEGRLGWRRRSLHNGPSITASQLRQRAEAVKADPNLFGSPAQRVALTAEHAAARFVADRPIQLETHTASRIRALFH